MIIKRDRVRIVDTCIQQWRNSYEAVPFAALRPLPATSAAYTTAHELSYGDTQYIRGRPALVCNRTHLAPAERQPATPASRTTSGVANTQAPSESADAASPTRDRENTVGGWTREY